MSTHPAYDPDPQADPVATEQDIRALIDHVVRAAAPRLGKTAVARIAKPLTDTLVAFREGVREEAEQQVAQLASILRTVDDVEWASDGPRAFTVNEPDPDGRTTYDVDNFARHLLGVPMRELPIEVGSELRNIEDVVRAGVGAVVQGRDGDRGVVVDAYGDGDGEATGVRWGSGADTGAYSWPMTVLVLAPEATS